MTRKRFYVGLALVAASVVAAAGVARACPFCSAVSMTFAEEMKASDVAVIAKLVQRPTTDPNDPTVEPAKSTFEVVQVLKGEPVLGETKKIDVLYFGQGEVGDKFLMYGIDPKQLAWGTPTAVTDQGVEYLSKLSSLAEKGPDRLAFFQKYFEDADALLATDAYNEFAKAPYAEIQASKDRMERDKLLGWIKDQNIPTSRRRLYLLMLGACGKPDDVPMIEAMIKDEDRQVRTALDAMIGCYLSLKGPDALPLVEELFLKNDKADYVDTWATIQALRTMGTETNVIDKERLVQSLRYMLDRPPLADLVIPDLARWQDWTVMDRLVKLFKEANEETSFVRVPVIHYLQQCPDPKAKEYIAELAKIDPDAVKRASSFIVPAASATTAAAEGSEATKNAPGEVTSDSPPVPEKSPTDKPADAADAAASKPETKPSEAKDDEEAVASADSSQPVPPTSTSPDSTSSDEPAISAPRPTTTDEAPSKSTTRGGPVADAFVVASADPSDGPREMSPPVNPPQQGKWLLYGALGAGAVLLLLLLVTVRGRPAPQ